MPAANGSPLIAVSYENVASKNFDFWMRFAWNARRFGYSAFILCAKGLTATDEQMMDKFCDENNASVQVFVTFKYEKEEQRKVMAGFGDIPDIWIDVEPTTLPPLVVEPVAEKDSENPEAPSK